ncbi:FliM/FliN family flagellar motor switch protein [Clostridium sp. CCUG 7971]|uniref:FliM/FliN family flagellar motor switch protein n=1 Tax=Clostridium sp. CCUG 7971 TaxID=2811414 RepID=UPI001ABA12E8|nr:FliM/FliN family flagellar motor switch protein [Clostridium sp. CCUG 7971]MBO3446326.1 FliM/FliN family flagellar motor switch protein [Clostridium sp. CCUG 7971]
MDTLKKYDNVYEVEFEQLEEGEKKSISAMNEIMNAQLDITVSIGETKEKLEKIAELGVGDVIILDKHLEEPLDISINGRVVASGESIILDNKLAIRLSTIKMEDDEN